MWWLLLGAIAIGALMYFWDDIRDWLQTTVLNWFEANYGLEARKAINKAIVTVDKVVVGYRRKVKITWRKKNKLFKELFSGPNFVEVEYADTISANSISGEVRGKLERGESLVQEYKLGG